MYRNVSLNENYTWSCLAHSGYSMSKYLPKIFYVVYWDNEDTAKIRMWVYVRVSHSLYELWMGKIYIKCWIIYKYIFLTKYLSTYIQIYAQGISWQYCQRYEKKWVCVCLCMSVCMCMRERERITSYHKWKTVQQLK